MGRGKGHIPIRRCVCCGARRSKNELIRMVLDEGNWLVRDEKGKEQGRGAYVCRRQTCLDQLYRNKRLRKVLKSGMPIKISPSLRAV